MVTGWQLVENWLEIANLFPVCKFKDKDHLKITKVHML